MISMYKTCFLRLHTLYSPAGNWVRSLLAQRAAFSGVLFSEVRQAVFFPKVKTKPTGPITCHIYWIYKRYILMRKNVFLLLTKQPYATTYFSCCVFVVHTWGNKGERGKLVGRSERGKKCRDLSEHIIVQTGITSSRFLFPLLFFFPFSFYHSFKQLALVVVCERVHSFVFWACHRYYSISSKLLHFLAM